MVSMSTNRVSRILKGVGGGGGGGGGFTLLILYYNFHRTYVRPRNSFIYSA